MDGMTNEPEAFDIAITGIGIVTPLGVGCSVNLERLLAGDSAVKNEIPAGVDACGAIDSARCPDFDLSGLLRFPKSIKYMSRPVQLAMRAAIEAFESSRLQRGQIDPYRMAMYTASGQTGLDYTDFSKAFDFAWSPEQEFDFRLLGGIPTKLIDPYFSLRTLGNGGIALLSTEFGAKGPSGNFVHSETAAALALQAACVEIAEGRCDAAIVGGFDSLLHPTSLFALSEAGVLSGEAAHFGQIVPAEGAAFFVIERRSDAVERGADIFGEILGIECSLEPPLRNGDQSSALRKLVRRLPRMCQSLPVVSSTTRATGYLGAATAAVELALGLLSARQGLVPAVTDPTGIFLSQSWSGQVAAIVARACSAEGKVFGACAP